MTSNEKFNFGVSEKHLARLGIGVSIILLPSVLNNFLCRILAIFTLIKCSSYSAWEWILLLSVLSPALLSFHILRFKKSAFKTWIMFGPLAIVNALVVGYGEYGLDSTGWLSFGFSIAGSFIFLAISVSFLVHSTVKKWIDFSK